MTPHRSAISELPSGVRQFWERGGSAVSRLARQRPATGLPPAGFDPHRGGRSLHRLCAPHHRPERRGRAAAWRRENDGLGAPRPAAGFLRRRDAGHAQEVRAGPGQGARRCARGQEPQHCRGGPRRASRCRACIFPPRQPGRGGNAPRTADALACSARPARRRPLRPHPAGAFQPSRPVPAGGSCCSRPQPDPLARCVPTTAGRRTSLASTRSLTSRRCPRSLRRVAHSRPDRRMAWKAAGHTS